MTILSRRALLATSLAAASAAAVTAPARARIPATPAEALWRGLALQDAAGREFQAGNGTAAVTVVNMWAHWCQACVAELPRLAAARAAGSTEIILLSHPEYWAQDQALARRMGVPFRLAIPSASNGAGAIAAALLTPAGGYEVPRSVVFRAKDDSVAFNRRGWTGAAVA